MEVENAARAGTLVAVRAHDDCLAAAVPVGLPEQPRASKGMAMTPSARPEIDLVRHSPIPLVLLDLVTQQVLEASDEGLRVLGGTRDEVVGQLATTFSDEKQLTTDALGLLTAGTVEGYQSPRRLRKADGTPFDAWVWTRRVPDADAVLLVLTDQPLQRDPHPVTVEHQPSVVGVVDDDWRIVTVSADVEDLLGVDPQALIGVEATERIHCDDVPELLYTVTECLRTGRSARAGVRILDGQDRWRRVKVLLSPLRDKGDRRLAFVLSSPTAADEEEVLSERLRRIANELRAAGLMPSTPTPTLARPDTDLSPRQLEILDRLLDGSRVPTIARELFVSQSTVRNHLSVIFRKFGVHSQVELIEQLRQTAGAA
ncbi:MAG: Response regulator containing a CheY-like receiver domain and an DNA-binding domain [Actinomycetia bacterium]|nr:Response regulator containing a CheY-like receiver domain and an DNA-binding domain [Actinomycetes bacterium]